MTKHWFCCYSLVAVTRELCFGPKEALAYWLGLFFWVMFMSKNCECQGGSKPCECSSKLVHLSGNIDASNRRNETVDGVEYLVVPLVMAIAGVQMNGGYLPLESLHADSWNGRPVTLSHPVDDDGGFLSASTVQTIEPYVIGMLLNTSVEGDKLKSEAFINVDKLNSLDPDVLPMLEDDNNDMDVSTGYWAVHTMQSNGLYEQTQVKPDHLALLPYSEGACNFQDGCGVRANILSIDGVKNILNFDQLAEVVSTMFNKKHDALKKAIEKVANVELPAAPKDWPGVINARSDDDQYMQMVADLISDDRSPFVADDWYGLTYFEKDTLKSLRDHFLKASDDGDEETANDKDGGEEEPDPNPDEPENNDSDDSEQTQNEEANTMSKDSVLSDEDKAAVNYAKSLVAREREKLVTHITSNSDMKKEELEGFEMNQLETIANGLKVNTFGNFSMRNGFDASQSNDDKEEADVIEMMDFNNRKKAGGDK